MHSPLAARIGLLLVLLVWCGIAPAEVNTTTAPITIERLNLPWSPVLQDDGMVPSPPDTAPSYLLPQAVLASTDVGTVVLPRGTRRRAPGFFGAFTPLFASDGLLWGKAGANALYGLDPRTLRVKRRLAVPGQNRRILSVGQNRVWALEQDANLPTAYRRLTVYDFAGKPLQSWSPKTGVAELLLWGRVDADAVWLAYADVSTQKLELDGERTSVTADDRFPTTEMRITGLRRLDRASGMAQDFPLPAETPLLRGSTCFVNAGNRIIISGSRAAASANPQPGQLATSEIYTFDKRTHAFAQMLALPLAPPTQLAMQDGRLWGFRADQAFVYDLQTLMPVDTPSTPPPTAPLAYLYTAGLVPRPLLAPDAPVLGYDAERVWLGAGRNRIAEVRDDGETYLYTLPDDVDFTAVPANTLPKSPAVALPGRLYLQDGAHRLLEITAGQPRATKHWYLQDNVTLLTRGFSRQHVWALAGTSLLCLTPGGETKVIPIPLDIPNTQQLSCVEDGDQLYFLTENDYTLWSADYLSGTVTELGEAANHNADGASGYTPPEKLFRTPQGTIAMSQYGLTLRKLNPTSPFVEILPNYKSFVTLYDPATKEWQTVQSVPATDELALPSGDVIAQINTDYWKAATDAKALIGWSVYGWNDAWHAPIFYGHMRLQAGTTRYLYASTPAGLYRVRWSALR